MSINNIFPQITMNLYETDRYQLQKFILNEKIEGEFKKEYLILYNFASDCKFSENIQPELIRYLLPFYLKTMEQAVLYRNKIAIDIYFEFNGAVFFNRKHFRDAVGEEEYHHIMEYYMEQTIRKMETENVSMVEWISLFNTTVAFCDENIRNLFERIFEGSLMAKYSFFQYLSVLLFKESDNLCVKNETREFWTSDIWDFDDGYFTRQFYWSGSVVEYFDKEINRERIQTLFKEIKPFLCDIIGPEWIPLLDEEMKRSFDTGIFSNRKAEFLKKINCVSQEYTYWDTTF